MVIARSALLRRAAAGAVLLSFVAASAWGQEAAGAAGKKAEKPKIYDESADGEAQVRDALARAARDNKRVLVMFGGNWCGWCHLLHEKVRATPALSKLMRYEYEWVLVDVGRFDKNMAVAERMEADLKKNGVPFLVVLDADGKVLTRQETGSLESGKEHDAEKVGAFLEKWKAAPRDAETALADALAQAKKEDRRVLLHFGAPWCGWCHRLEEFLARPEIAPLIAKDYVDLKIDVDRMTHGKDVHVRIRGTDKGGIPWMAILSADGKTIADSDAASGNIGYPVEPAEIAHFMQMLERTGKNLDDAARATIRSTLEQIARQIKAPREPS